MNYIDRVLKSSLPNQKENNLYLFYWVYFGKVTETWETMCSIWWTNMHLHLIAFWLILSSSGQELFSAFN